MLMGLISIRNKYRYVIMMYSSDSFYKSEPLLFKGLPSGIFTS